MGRKAKKRKITDKLLIKICDDMNSKELTLNQYAVNVLDCTPQTLTNWFRNDCVPSSKRKAIEAGFKKASIKKLIDEIKGA
nr:MAG TPA: helix-turn-helix domain protein [Caudoviricetes sp.]